MEEISPPVLPVLCDGDDTPAEEEEIILQKISKNMTQPPHTKKHNVCDVNCEAAMDTIYPTNLLILVEKRKYSLACFGLI